VRLGQQGREGILQSVDAHFAVLDHAARDGVGGIVSIVGGKPTTFRLIAERTADAGCTRLGVVQPCTTATTEIVPARARAGR
jgi:glycerol-3-phosphate dehydrogenase